MDTIPSEEFLPQAEQLKPGQKRRVDHLCGGGRTMVIENKEDGYSAWCFRCSAKGWVAHPQLSLAERIERLNKARSEDEAAKAIKSPPKPTSFNPQEWPEHARLWLYKAGLSNDVIEDHGIYYTARLDRVVLPVFSEGKLVYWQARGFDKGRAKYLNPDIDKPFAFFGSGDVVITEDILSAIRVAGAGYAGLCILGTSLPAEQVPMVLRYVGKGRTFVWLDPDTAGKKGRARIAKLLRLSGLDPIIIRSEQDPKFYSNAQIQEFLQSP